MSGLSHEKLLDKVSADLADFLVFAGILDNNAKLLSFRRGKASFSLPIERHDTLDVQVSLMFSLIRQLEDIAGGHKFTATRFGKYEIFLLGTSDLHIFIITSPGSGQHTVKAIEELAETVGRNQAVAPPAPTLPKRPPIAKEQAVVAPAASPATIRRDEPVIDEQQQFSILKGQRPEAVVMLQGYLMGVEGGYAIEEDEGGYYKIKVGEGGRFSWAILEKINSVFGDRIEIHHLDTDLDGRLAVRFSSKEH